MVENKTVFIPQHPFALGSFSNWLKLLWYSGGVDPQYIHRGFLILLSSFSTIPFRLYEKVKYCSVLNTSPIQQPPIFIVGHWRSGTTYLHNLMAQDKNSGYISTFQAIAPELFLVGDRTIKSVLIRAISSKRVMDNVALSLDGPQEEEFAIANLSPYSFYHHWSFPRKARCYFERYVLFHGIPEEIIIQWRKIYVMILERAALYVGGKRLVIKNPVNTGRIKILLGLFPDAKFVHIYRNPYLVFLSTLNLYKRLLAITQLQAISQNEMEANITWFYQQIMKKFLNEKKLIPPKHLVEVRFENLEANPLGELRRIYEELDIFGFTEAEGAFRAYIASQSDYQKNKYDLDPTAIKKVNQHWAFAFKEWGYNPIAIV